MLERLKDWRTTVPALIIGALIIGAMLYAMHSRPEWGLPELVAFGGGVATIITGALTKSAQPATEKPAAPAVPPVPPLGVLMVVCLSLAGCASPITTAIRATNGARQVGETARTAITAACVPAYRAANTAAALAAVDARCLPAERAYVTYAAAHAVAVATVQLAQAGQASEGDAVAAALAVGRAGAALADAVRAVAP